MPTDVLHRTAGNGGYARGCRCPLCTDAHRRYQRHYEQQHADRVNGRRRRRRHEQAAGVRFAFADLEQLLGAPGPTAVAMRLQVTRDHVHRWRRVGLTVLEADELAGRAGHHPTEAWPGWA